MNNDYIICPSCNRNLKRNPSHINYNCYCPLCGQAIRVSGYECYIRNEDDQGTLELRNELQSTMQNADWYNALHFAFQIHSITKDKNDWIVVAEIMFQQYMASTQLYHAYLALFGILESGIETIIKEESYYTNELKHLQMFLGLIPFDEVQAYEYICNHKPASVELNEYFSNFLRASIISAKCGRKNPELETDPRVIPSIIAFANSYGIKYKKGKNYKPLQIKHIKKKMYIIDKD